MRAELSAELSAAKIACAQRPFEGWRSGWREVFSTSEDAKRATGAHRGASIASEGAEGVRAEGAATKGLLLRSERAGQAVVVRVPDLALLAPSERARARVWN